ncbi:hypothetical protein HDU96_007343 [Phlyctochytrium bullatum]|nr:hypothetical protein HDU96_007343 [Phlyctochytrium bullatum]
MGKTSPTRSRSSSPSPSSSPMRTSPPSPAAFGWLLGAFAVFELLRGLLLEASIVASPSSLPGDPQPWMHASLLMLITDGIKLILTLVVVLATTRNFSVSHFPSFLLPSTLIFINQCITLSLSNHTSAATINYLLLLQLPLTAILHHFSLNKQTSLGFATLLAAFLGVLLSHLNDNLEFDSVWPIVVCAIMAINASIATIATEKMLKTLNMPFWDQMLRMYALGALGSGVLTFASSRHGRIVDPEAFGDGVLPATIGTIIAGAISGIIAAIMIFKLDSNVKTLSAAAVSALLPLFMFVVFGSFRGSTELFTVGAALFFAAAYFYTKTSSPNQVLAEYVPLDVGPTPAKTSTWSWKTAALVLLASFAVQQALLLLHVSDTRRPGFRCSVDPREYLEKFATEDGLSVVRDIDEECALATPRAMAKCTVPKVLHLVLFGGHFKMHHYLAMRSMNQKIKPEKFFIHGSDFPHGQEFFDRVIKEFKPILIPSRNASTIYNHTIGGYEHRSDALRLESIIRFGGMYYDLDVFVTKDMDKFLDNEATMGAQPGRGINNGMIIGKRCARFLRNWHRQYRTFDDSQWDTHSVWLPGQLYEKNPRGLVLESEALYNHWPGKNAFDEKHDPEFWKPIHAIHSFYRDYGKEHTEEEFKTLENNLGRFARHLLFGGPAMDEYIPPVSNHTGGNSTQEAGPPRR